MASQFKPAHTLADDPDMAVTQDALIVLSYEFSAVASEEITPGTIARMHRLLAKQSQHLNSMISVANGGLDSF